MSTVRLQVALAKSGIASRRKAQEFIESKRIKVNGRFVTEKGFRVNMEKDRVTFDGNSLVFEKKSYYILNKPSGVLSTALDERGRKTVLDYLKKKKTRLYPVGRLDKDTTGLLILTNDGELTYRLTHPKFGIERVYEVKADGVVKKEEAARLKNGIVIDGELARIEKVILEKKSPDFTIFLLVLHEGRKRQIRRMFEAIGHGVQKLKRIAYGPLNLGDLKEGSARILSDNEIKKLKKAVGLYEA